MKSIIHTWRKRIADGIAETTFISRARILGLLCKIVDVNSSLGHKSSVLSCESL